MKEEGIFRCMECGWEGSNVEHEVVDTCAGSDDTEICPECGSINVVPVFK